MRFRPLLPHIPVVQVDRAKVLSNTIKQKRKEKAGKWEVPLPQVSGAWEQGTRGLGLVATGCGQGCGAAGRSAPALASWALPGVEQAVEACHPAWDGSSVEPRRTSRVADGSVGVIPQAGLTSCRGAQALARSCTPAVWHPQPSSIVDLRYSVGGTASVPPARGPRKTWIVSAADSCGVGGHKLPTEGLWLFITLLQHFSR